MRLRTEFEVVYTSLRFQDGRALIYVFRPSHLAQDLQNDTAYKILMELGYNVKMSNACVLHLMRRLGEGEEFPHEIGLFLDILPAIRYPKKGLSREYRRE